MRSSGGFRGAELIGASDVMQALRRQIAAAAPLRSTVLLCGETGSGKGLVARLLHANSPRAAEGFVHLDCAALPPDLAESELFGHERGSFTGAVSRRIGRFERAARGTVFLDEIGEIRPAHQGRLLRVLQDREFERVGGDRTLSMSARVIAASSRDLSRAVADGEFRADLYFRLNVVRIEIPPLRDRPGDVRQLADTGMARLANELGLARPGLSEPALERLAAHDWPGNVRELMNVLERLLVRYAGERVTPQQVEATLEDGCIPRAGREATPPAGIEFGRRGRIENPVDRIAPALREHGGNVARAARHLGVPRSTLRHWIRRYGIDRSVDTRVAKGPADPSPHR